MLFLRSALIVSLFVSPIFSMDKDSNDPYRKLSIYEGWEVINDSNDPLNATDDNEEDFELKARALGSTVASILGGAGMHIFNFGINLIESRIQNNINQFDHGVRIGSQLVGNIYGQGIALERAYENEKDLLKKKQK